MSYDIHVLHIPGADPERDAVVTKIWDDASESDPVIPVTVHMDPERQGLMKNWLRALDAAVIAGHDWTVILQDDAMPLPGWQDALEQALWYSPSPILGLTYFRTATRRAVKANAAYLVGEYTIWGGAVAYRKDILADMAQWARWIYEETGFSSTDRGTGAFANSRGFDTALTTFAIFDQAVTGSTLGHGTWDRRPSHTIAGPLPRMLQPRYSARETVRHIQSGGSVKLRTYISTYGTPAEDVTVKVHYARPYACSLVPRSPEEQDARRAAIGEVVR